MDRDYTLKKNGTGGDSSFIVMPQDVGKFRNKKAKPFGESAIEKIMISAFKPNYDDLKDHGFDYNDPEAPEDDDDDKPRKSKSKSSTSKKSASKKPVKKQKTKSLRDKMEELEDDEIEEIAIEMGVSKKEIKRFEDSEELLDYLFDDYEEEDIQDEYDNLMAQEDDYEEEDED